MHAMTPAERRRIASSMRLLCGLTVLLLGGTAGIRAEAVPLTKEEQARVAQAVDQGVDFLKHTQGSNGTWAGTQEVHPVGYAALPGLTLLECGVPPTDPVIQRTASYVRRFTSSLDWTYDIALSILFLDRLGDPKDKELIQGLAVRLVAGQAATGGWTYKCPITGKKTQQEILVALRQLDPRPLQAIAAEKKKPDERPMLALTATIGAPLSGTAKERQPSDPPLSGTTTNGKPSGSPGGSVAESKPGDRKPDSTLPIANPPPLRKPQEKEAAPAKPVAPAAEVPARLKGLTVFKDPEKLVMRDPVATGVPRMTVTDNSNTQFAILALWVAQRHDVPLDRTLRLMVRRFETSQNVDGGWSYHYQYGGSLSEPRSIAMTCVGLLGLAVGHGLAQSAPPKLVQDPRILNGMAALGRNVGTPVGAWQGLPMENLYFLWSVERVAVLYNLATIADKDWYRWGAEMLLANQQRRGCWTDGGYHKSTPAIDTCFALLFLKRANFVADLTAKLPFKPGELGKSITLRSTPPMSPSPGESRAPEKKPPE